MRGLRTHEGVVHAALLRTGKVLFITADETTLVWDPEDVTAAAFQEPRNQPHSMPGGYSQLCGHHVFLSDGRLLSVGGGGYGSTPVARWGYKFDPIANTWERTSTPMSDSRRYPTAVALGDRRVLVACGHGTGEIDIYDESTDAFTHVDLNRKSFLSLYPACISCQTTRSSIREPAGHARACRRSLRGRRPVRLLHADRPLRRKLDVDRDGRSQHRRPHERHVRPGPRQHQATRAGPGVRWRRSIDEQQL